MYICIYAHPYVYTYMSIQLLIRLLSKPCSLNPAA